MSDRTETRDGIAYEWSSLSMALDDTDDVMMSRGHRLSSYANEEYAVALRDELSKRGLSLHIDSGNSSIDDAWAEVEAALPEGWHIDRLSWAVPGGPFPGGRWRPEEGVWRALTTYIDGDLYEEGLEGEGETPAAALRDLAARLRGMA